MLPRCPSLDGASYRKTSEQPDERTGSIRNKHDHCFKRERILLYTLVTEYFEPIRKDIHNRFGSGADRISNIFAYTDQEDYADEFKDTDHHMDNNTIVTKDTIDNEEW